MATFVQVGEASTLGKHEGLLLHHRLNQFRGIGILGLVTGEMILPDIAEILQEQQRQHVILIDRGVDDASESVTGSPCGFVVFRLGNGGHSSILPGDFSRYFNSILRRRPDL